MSIVMTGGGTGGHLTIIKAVKEHILDVELIYIGSTKGQDQAWFANDKQFESTHFLPTQGVVNQGLLGKFKSIFMLIKATINARSILKKAKVKTVFCVGGFSAAPTSFAAITLGIPLVIHEQNAAIGSLNKLLRSRAKAFITSYEDESPIKAYPIKNEYFKKSRIRESIQTIMFLGGSQGAKAINELALELAPTLKEKNIKIIHQAGERNIQEVQKAYSKLEIEAEVFGFSTKISDYMQEADFAIARSGASTLWELSAIACPALYIPYPYAAADHQFYNAKFLVDQNVAWIMRENELDVQKVLPLLSENMKEKSTKLQGMIEKNGALQISELLKTVN
ncbi:MAG: UDP-N-acetylglucosamine--N-acetylmuramyl-(pentapeptide) pyrophosphoryl-undecaprenol N-acetylglucosamine transferase (EC [uncultured Sulfurovum sp.]|uniref:UDP-N-acetylglucosamine--N-acetylmuramyl-(pentapeptide) pyrophosphoryl-undecaprenol N-acetylglucosamine transferase n=1 Tax=uncultured Sulfurovum sp. TaxID=269237 RepID=A0A6S6U269_9BACT|nr:MAG: UDP-N-acetylglucosamine--N-acetylmuramyl-(pentapeptide) pyrophosphoryl-undecaprenol N-acetylglucosamine transferase (EC [uncultured Sulfurovum sp.]